MDAFGERLLAVLGPAGTRTIEEVAAEYALTPEDLVLTRRALGLSAQLSEPVHGAELENHAARMRSSLDVGVQRETLIAINRVIGRAMAAIAGGAQDAISELLTDVPPAGRELRAAEAVESLTPELERVLLYAFREHARQLLREEAGAALLRAGDPAADVRDVAVAFADLVGFTTLGDAAGPTPLAQAAGALEEVVEAVRRPRVTLVKVLGDAVMLVAPEPAPLLATLHDAIAAAAAAPALPALRAGLAFGPALARGGDWYGHTVNLASRLTAEAPPGRILADAGLRARVDGPWEDGGARALKGIAEPVATLLG